MARGRAGRSIAMLSIGRALSAIKCSGRAIGRKLWSVGAPIMRCGTNHCAFWRLIWMDCWKISRLLRLPGQQCAGIYRGDLDVVGLKRAPETIGALPRKLKAPPKYTDDFYLSLEWVRLVRQIKRARCVL